MNDTEMQLSTSGPGIALFSPGMTTGIPEGSNFLMEEFVRPEDIGRHVRAGDVTAFCTGSPGNYHLRFLGGYPDEETGGEYPVALRLGVEIRGGEIWVTDLFWLSDFPKSCPPDQVVKLPDGFYHVTVLTRRPESGCWGDDQSIRIYLQPLPAMPPRRWPGAPLLLPSEEW